MDSLPLPNELILSIIEFLDMKSIVFFGASCKVHGDVVSGNAKVLTRTFKTEVSTDREDIQKTVTVNPLGLAKVEKKCHKCTRGRVFRTVAKDTTGTLMRGKKEGVWKTVHSDRNVFAKLWENGESKHQHAIHHDREHFYEYQESDEGTRVSVCTFIEDGFGKKRVCSKTWDCHPVFYKITDPDSMEADDKVKYSHCCEEHQGKMPNRLF